MKTTTPEMDTHLAGEVTSLARCWKITRTDGVEFLFTDHDVNIEFPPASGDIYIATEGFSASAIANNAGLDVDNLNVVGIFDDDSIKEDEIAAGLFDYAQVRLFIVNWKDLTMEDVKMRRGWFGEAIPSTSGLFSIELRGMTQVLQQAIGELTGPECRADVGDHRCKVPIDPPVVERETDYAVGDYVKVVTDPGADEYAQYENRVYRCVTAGYTADVQPTYDEVVGNETVDGLGAGATSGNYTPPVANFTNGQFIRIDDIHYTFVPSLVATTAGSILIGATVADSMANLHAAITGGPGAGTLYHIDTPVNDVVTATLGMGDVLTVELADFIIPGQKVLLSEFTNGSWDVASLDSTSNAAVFEAEEAWSRHFEVSAVTSKLVFNITVTDSRAVNDWFNGGVVTFYTGDNTGRSFEVKDWVQSGGQVTLFIPAGYTIQVGDLGSIYPGCDKRLETCRDLFNNILNFRGEPYLPGQDSAMAYPDSK